MKPPMLSRLEQKRLARLRRAAAGRANRKAKQQNPSYYQGDK